MSNINIPISLGSHMNSKTKGFELKIKNDVKAALNDV